MSYLSIFFQMEKEYSFHEIQCNCDGDGVITPEDFQSPLPPDLSSLLEPHVHSTTTEDTALIS